MMRGLFYCILGLAAFLAHPGQAQTFPIKVAVEDGTGGEEAQPPLLN